MFVGPRRADHGRVPDRGRTGASARAGSVREPRRSAVQRLHPAVRGGLVRAARCPDRRDRAREEGRRRPDVVRLPLLLIFSALLFSAGIYGVLARRNAVMVLMAIELMLNAVNVNLVAFSAELQDVGRQVFALFVIADRRGRGRDRSRHRDPALPQPGVDQRGRGEPPQVVDLVGILAAEGSGAVARAAPQLVRRARVPDPAAPVRGGRPHPVLRQAHARQGPGLRHRGALRSAWSCRSGCCGASCRVAGTSSTTSSGSRSGRSTWSSASSWTA